MQVARGPVIAAVLALALVAAPLSAQEAATPAVPGDQRVLVIDQDALFSGSAWGKRVEAEIVAASSALTAENRKIEADLTVEEKSLTERRATMAPDAFRSEADAFDEKVVAIRAAQDAKARDIAARRDGGRQAFFAAALPYFAAVMRDRGAVAILDKRTVFLSAKSIDITAEMIARVDAEVGAGPAAAPAPAGPPAAAPQVDAPAGGGN